MPKQILLVEDSVTMQKVVQITFAREDFQIVTATTADEALARCKDARPDVVLADAGLSGKSGYDLAAAVKADVGAIPVILLTGNFNPYDEARGQRAGIDGHIVKPFDTQSLIDKVKTVLGAGPAVAAPKSATPAPVAAPAAKPAVAPAPAAAAAAPPRQTPAPVAAPVSTPAAVAAGEAARSTMMGMPSMSPPVGSPAMRPPAAAPAAPRPTPSAAAPAAARSESPAIEGSRMPEPVRTSPAASGMPQMPRPSLIPRAPVPATVLAALERIAARGPEYEAIAKLSVEAIQQIAWEVVPELAEVILKAEAERYVKERKS